MIERLLVANRGEIARRVFATCRQLGIETVAVHSDADAGLAFVAEADRAVRLPGNTPAETYLRGDLVIEAAQRAGADAIHPGYGFLSENADFARAVVEAGLTWVGPAPESIEQMGSKIESKKLMEAAGVPVLANHTVDSATEADLPLLVKASAGGGGRGMRVVRTLAELPGEIAKAAAEAESAFGDGTVFVEPYVERGRHVEVQVVGDTHGVVQVFGERDCSLQRRHQKVVEEAPAPNLPDDTRTALHDAARKAAEAIGYVGAGTVEFLYDAERDRFFFLEMNTRLQVEHPVTEAIFGVDLVALQIAVAEGRSSAEVAAPATTSALNPSGHAIEVRLYAEDPVADYQPQTGRLVLFDIEHESEFRQAGQGIRLDSGFRTGDEVGTFYDPMLAKVVSWAPTREQAARQLAGALKRARIHGLTTNRDQLVAALTDEAFLAGDVSTAYLVEHPPTPVTRDTEALAFAAAIMLAEQEVTERVVQQGIPVAWRNVVSQPQRTAFTVDTDDVVVEWHHDRDGYRHATRDDLRVTEAGPAGVVLEIDGVASHFSGPIVATVDGSTRELHLDSPVGSATVTSVARFTDPADQVSAGSLLAPMPGTVVSVAVSEGNRVERGQTVLVLEAMKMQHTVAAPTDGVVTQIDVKPGDQVAAGAVLAVVTDPAPDTDHAEQEES